MGLIEAVGGALALLGEDENWEQFGDMTVEETTQIMREMLIRWYDDACEPATVDTPYWDDASDVDDELSDVEQPWYGKVENASVPPDELTFIEDATIWIFTGLLAVATVEAAFVPAIAFRTIAPKFVVAIRTGDFGRIIRLFVDGSEAARVEDDGSGDIINMPVVGDPALETHQIYITSGVS